MKPTSLMAAALLLNLTAPGARGQDPAPAPPKCEMCEMMMKKTAPSLQVNERIAELDRLGTEMNGSLGPRKVEAIAAVVTRLVEQYKMQVETKPEPPAAPPKEEAHQH